MSGQLHNSAGKKTITCPTAQWGRSHEFRARQKLL